MSLIKTDSQERRYSSASKRTFILERPSTSTEIYISSDENSTKSSNSCSDSGHLDSGCSSDDELIELHDPESLKSCKSPAKPILSNKMKAVIFINIFCVFDTCDNINAKSAMVKGVDFMDLALSRIALNFVSACFFVHFFKMKVFSSVPNEFRWSLFSRSVMMMASQTLNCFAI